MISIKNKNLWKFSSIPGIEESTFNKVLEKFYDLGISGLVRENVQMGEFMDLYKETIGENAFSFLLSF